VIRRLALALVALLPVACGGNDEKPRPPDPGACRPIVPLVDYPDPWIGKVDCNALDGFEVMLLDRFEDNLTSQAWYINNDRTAEQKPPVHTNAPPYISSIPGGRCAGVAPSADAARICDLSDPTVLPGNCPADSEHTLAPEALSAIHITTGNLTNNGGQLGQTLARCPAAPPPPAPNPYECKKFAPGSSEKGACSTADAPTRGQLECKGLNASEWEGIVFWGRVGPGSQVTVKVRAADKATDDKGCVCNPNTNQNDSSDGCDKWGRFVTLDQTFRAYMVPFSDLQQGGWGAASPRLDTGDLFSIAIEYGRGAWDLWLDDIGFYRRKP
jgi:hypothetical protein